MPLLLLKISRIKELLLEDFLSNQCYDLHVRVPSSFTGLIRMKQLMVLEAKCFHAKVNLHQKSHYSFFYAKLSYRSVLQTDHLEIVQKKLYSRFYCHQIMCCTASSKNLHGFIDNKISYRLYTLSSYYLT